MELNTSIYQNLQEIDAETFHDVKFTGNFYKLDKNYTKDKKYTDLDLINLHQGWLDLYDEYYKKSDDVTYRAKLKSKKRSFSLLFAVKKGKDFINLLEFISENKDYIPSGVYIEVLSSISNSFNKLSKEYRYNHELELEDNIEYNKRVLLGLETRYKLEHQDNLDIQERDISLFYDIKANIEQLLEKDYIPSHVNMLQWIAYEKQYKKKVKQIKKLKNGK